MGPTSPSMRDRWGETEIYLASSDVEAGRKNREEALRRISQILAGRIVEAIYLDDVEKGS